MKFLTLLPLVTLLFAALTSPLAAQQKPPTSNKPRTLAIPPEANPDAVRDAGNAAVQKLATDLVNLTGDVPKKFAVLPLQNDIEGGYFTMQFQNAFARLGAQRGFELYARDDGQLSALLQEIEWGDTFRDTMDPATVQKFGRLQGVQAIIVGRVTGISLDEAKNPQVRIALQAFEVETGRQLWGSEEKGVPSSKGMGVSSGGWLPLLGGLAGLVILFFIVRAIRRAARPR